MPSMEEIKAGVDEIKGLVTASQEELNTLGEKGKTTSDALEKMGEKFGELSEAHQKNMAELETEKKAREELELSMSRMAATSGSGDEKAVSDPNYIKDFACFLAEKKDVGMDNQEKEFELGLKYYGLEHKTDAQKSVLKGLMTGSQPSQGYMVPIQVLTRFTERMFETSEMRSIAEVINTATERVVRPLDDGLFTSRKVNELTIGTKTDNSEMAEIEFPVTKQEAMPWVTQDMLDDAAFNPEQYIMKKLNQIFTLTENTEFVNGSGSKEAQGFMTLPAWAAAGEYERGALEDITTSTSGAILGDDLIDIQSRLIQPFQKNAVWTINRLIWAYILKLKDAVNGNYLLNPAMLFSGALGMQLLGNPVKIFSDMPNAVVAGNYALAYGDFRAGYLVIDRFGMRMIRDDVTEKGRVLYYTTKRTGGGVQDYQPIKRLKVKA